MSSQKDAEKAEKRAAEEKPITPAKKALIVQEPSDLVGSDPPEGLLEHSKGDDNQTDNLSGCATIGDFKVSCKLLKKSNKGENDKGADHHFEVQFKYCKQFEDAGFSGVRVRIDRAKDAE